MPSQRGVQLYRGYPATLTVAINHDDSLLPWDLTDVDEIAILIKADRDALDSTATRLTLTNDDIALIRAEYGEFEVTIPDEQLLVPRTCWYRIEFTQDGVTTPAAYGPLTITAL